MTARSSSPRLAISLFLYPRTVRFRSAGDITRLFNFRTKFTPKQYFFLHMVEHLARRAVTRHPRGGVDGFLPPPTMFYTV
jgi:hypothetical protein